MSYYLVFRKNGVEILSLGTSHSLAQAFVHKPHDKWAPMARTEFSDAMHTLIRQDEEMEDRIDTYTRMLKTSENWEDRFEAISVIKELEKERKAIAEAKVMLNMLEMIWTEGAYSDDGDKSGLDWGVF